MSKALLLDRDGVINVDHGYTFQIDKFDFIEGIFSLCQRFYSAGYKLIVVTNQSGIARGCYSVDQFEHLTAWMCLQFEQRGVPLTDVLYCPHHPREGNSQFTRHCTCRKPEPGMLLQAAQKHQLVLSQSVMLGDSMRDIKAAAQAGVGRKILFCPQKPDELVRADFEQVSSLHAISP